MKEGESPVGTAEKQVLRFAQDDKVFGLTDY